MPMTPAQRHKLRVLAEKAAQAAALANPHGETTGTAYELMQAQLHEHGRTLKGIQSVEKKVEAKRRMLADFDPYLDGVLQADVGTQDNVVTTLLVWHLDTGNWQRAIELADYCMRHALQLPDMYQRSLPTLLIDETSDAAIKGAVTGTDALGMLGRVGVLTEQSDVPDQARAKLHKAIGWAAIGKTAVHEVDVKQLQLEPVRIALPHLQRAIELHAQVGVKKDVERLERRLKELQPDAPN